MAQPTRNKRKAQGGASGSYSDAYKKSATNSAVPAASGVAVTGAAAATMAATTPARETSLRASDDVDWGNEYSYVLADLKYLGIVTAIIAGGIIVVGIFI